MEDYELNRLRHELATFKRDLRAGHALRERTQWPERDYLSIEPSASDVIHGIEAVLDKIEAGS